VDDVITTGATVETAANALDSAGLPRLTCWLWPGWCAPDEQPFTASYGVPPCRSGLAKRLRDMKLIVIPGSRGNLPTVAV